MRRGLMVGGVLFLAGLLGCHKTSTTVQTTDTPAPAPGPKAMSGAGGPMRSPSLMAAPPGVQTGSQGGLKQ